MPRTSTATSRAAAIPAQTLVLDNGGYSIKAGVVSSSKTTVPNCFIIPNCIAKSVRDRRNYISSELDSCRDFGALQFRRPVEKGFVVNWEGERAIWDYEFGDKGRLKGLVPGDVNLVLSEAPNAPQRLQEMTDQMIFEEFGFASAYRSIAPTLNVYNDTISLFGDPPNAERSPAEVLLVIDSGYSHTTITPIIRGRPLQSAIRRLTVGGKLMTNYLKELLSIRHYSMMDETYLVNEIKEDVSFVSMNLSNDLDRTWKGYSGPKKSADPDLRVDYLLPDYEARIRGEMRAHVPQPPKRTLVPGQKREEVLTLANERFTVPELLFSPTDIGLKEAGIPEIVMESLSVLPRGLWPALLANVLVVGGNATIPNFVERLERDLRKLAPAEFAVRLRKPEQPVTYTWQGGASLASNKEWLKGKVVTKEEYAEHGSLWVGKKFAAVAEK